MPGIKFQTNSGKSLLAVGVISLLAGVQPAHAAVTTYKVTETFNQVVYNNSNPTWDTTFTGSFVFDSDSQTVSNLTGSLSQAMTGNTSFRQLAYQLSSVYDASLGGFLVSSFLLNNTDTFSNSGGVANSVGFATGGTKEIVGNQNAYVTIFVNATNPLAAPSQAQIDELAYGDCTPGSLMGMGSGAKTCMTGWVKYTNGVAGAGGTMQGTFPITQTITAAVPEPETYALMLAGLGLLGFMAGRRRES
jgi:hypothetical protein